MLAMTPKHKTTREEKIAYALRCMASRTVQGREPSEKQHKYLHSLFFKLGGKIT